MSVLEADRRPGCEAHREAFMLLVEASNLRMTEEQTPDHVSGASFDGHRQVAANRQVTRWHPVIGSVFSVARILCDIGAADGAQPLERVLEDRRVAGHR